MVARVALARPRQSDPGCVGDCHTCAGFALLRYPSASHRPLGILPVAECKGTTRRGASSPGHLRHVDQGPRKRRRDSLDRARHGIAVVAEPARSHCSHWSHEVRQDARGPGVDPHRRAERPRLRCIPACGRHQRHRSGTPCIGRGRSARSTLPFLHRRHRRAPGRSILERLSICIDTIARNRPDARFVITLQVERLQLSETLQAWVEKHRFHRISPPDLTAEQRHELAESGTKTLKASLDAGSSGGPWQRCADRQAVGYRLGASSSVGSQSRQASTYRGDVEALLAEGEQAVWARQRQNIIKVEPAAEQLLESIGTFFSAGVTPRESSILRYAAFRMPNVYEARSEAAAFTPGRRSPAAVCYRGY